MSINDLHAFYVDAEVASWILRGLVSCPPYVGGYDSSKHPDCLEIETAMNPSGHLIESLHVMGAIPMEDMDLVVMPQQRTVEVNPLNPNVAAAKAK
jgi:hypothetical protein